MARRELSAVEAALDAWLAPFLDVLGRKTRRRWAPLYLHGLLGPEGRRRLQPLAARLGLGGHDRLQHLIASRAWDDAALGRVLVAKADALVGGPDAALVVDDAALPKKGRHSVGVARRYCGCPGNRANCQVLVSLTLPRAEVPVPVGLRLFLPTLAKASLGLGDWDAVERNVRAYAAAEDAKAFQITSTLRQFTQVWDLEATGDRGRGLVATLRARLLQLPGGGLEMAPDELQRMRAQPAPDPGQLKAVLGTAGAQTYRWWKTGLDRALAVAAIRERPWIWTGCTSLSGSCGARRSSATTRHYCACRRRSPALRRCRWRKASRPWSRRPASISSAIGGRDLAFSFQDNELLDHEGPPAGKPQIPGVCRVHYRAPTEGGSSGSPVFNARLWEVIALHHMGGRDIPRLNGMDGTYAANEGISIPSIKKAIASS